jgi:ribosomal RNA-processing protein 9
LWTQLKRKPVVVVRNAHGPEVIAAKDPSLAGAASQSGALAVSGTPPDVTGWVQSVAAIRGSDVVASGAGDGAVRLWQVASGKAGGLAGLKPLASLPARGWVNGLALARSGAFVAAAMGQEPRMGRWARDGAAHNGLLIHRLRGVGGAAAGGGSAEGTDDSEGEA